MRACGRLFGEFRTRETTIFWWLTLAHASFVALSFYGEYGLLCVWGWGWGVEEVCRVYKVPLGRHAHPGLYSRPSIGAYFDM